MYFSGHQVFVREGVGMDDLTEVGLRLSGEVVDVFCVKYLIME